MHANVDHIDCDYEKESKNDIEQTSITPSECKDALFEAKSDCFTVRSNITVSKDSESADEFILNHETVVLLVQDFIAEAVDQQKQKSDRNETANALLLKEGNLLLHSTVNLPRHIVTNVGVTCNYPCSSVHFVCCSA